MFVCAWVGIDSVQHSLTHSFLLSLSLFGFRSGIHFGTRALSRSLSLSLLLALSTPSFAHSLARALSLALTSVAPSSHACPFSARDFAISLPLLPLRSLTLLSLSLFVPCCPWSPLACSFACAISFSLVPCAPPAHSLLLSIFQSHGTKNLLVSFWREDYSGGGILG